MTRTPRIPGSVWAQDEATPCPCFGKGQRSSGLPSPPGRVGGERPPDRRLTPLPSDKQAVITPSPLRLIVAFTAPAEHLVYTPTSPALRESPGATRAIPRRLLLDEPTSPVSGEETGALRGQGLARGRPPRPTPFPSPLPGTRKLKGSWRNWTASPSRRCTICISTTLPAPWGPTPAVVAASGRLGRTPYSASRPRPRPPGPAKPAAPNPLCRTTTPKWTGRTGRSASSW